MNFLKAAGVALLAGIIGYGVGVGLGFLLINAFSTNSFDKDMEAVMTAFFCAGPVLAVVGLIAGFAVYWYRRRR